MAKKKRYPEQATNMAGEANPSSAEDTREVHISERLIGMLDQIRTAHPAIEPRVAGRSSAAAGAGASALSWIGLLVAFGTWGLSLFLFFQWKDSQK
jgi:hypothetical protein